MTLSSWYFGSESIYFDIFYADSKVQRFKIVIKPDLSDASLHFINMSEINSEDFMESLGSYRVCDGYQICEDALVYLWDNGNCKAWGTYAGLTSAPFTNIVTRWDARFDSLCPASGRFVYYAYDDIFLKFYTVYTCNNRPNLKIVVADLF